MLYTWWLVAVAVAVAVAAGGGGGAGAGAGGYYSNILGKMYEHVVKGVLIFWGKYAKQ